MDAPLYYFRKTRRQHARVFINMAIACLVFMAGFGWAQHYNGLVVSNGTIMGVYIGFSVAFVVLVSVVVWLFRHPATYEVTITKERFCIVYPQSEQWSFDVEIRKIVRFETRNTLSHAGKGIAQTGIVLDGGQFKPIVLNYFNGETRWKNLTPLKAMHTAIATVNPNVTVHYGVNYKVEGFLSRSFKE